MDKIDFVIPMVFENDPLWQADFTRLGRNYSDKAFFAARWRSWGTEHLLVKAVKRFMPWIRKIHILLARESQIKDWMEEEGVHIVLHKEFIPEKFLPTFNSNTIEMFLNKIPDLSEYFIYGNDDVFPLSPLDITAFFEDGKPCQKLISCKYPEKPNTYQAFVMNGLNMVASSFGKHFSDRWLVSGHCLSPFLKSTCDKVWELHGEQILKTITMEREEDNYNQNIYIYYQYFSGEYCDRLPARLLLSVAFPLSEIERIIKKGFGIVCINDHESSIDFDAYRTTVYNALKQKITAN